MSEPLEIDLRLPSTARPRPGRSFTRLADRVSVVFLSGAAAFVIVTIAGVIVFMARPGLHTFRSVSPWTFLTGTSWSTEAGRFGSVPLWLGSVATSVLALALAAPVSIVTAVFMTEMAPPFLARLLRGAVQLFASIPSVVYGFLGLTVLVPALQRHPGDTGLGILPAGLILAVMALPTVISIAVDALIAQPRTRREAALALGATRWQAVWGVIIPAATPGIVAAVIFGFARAVGETMAVQMVIGNAPVVPHGLAQPAATLSSQIVMDMANTVPGTIENDSLFALGLLLLAISTVLIVLARRVAHRAARAGT